MKQKIPKYMKVLRIELEDLETDLEMLSNLYRQREADGEITDYVFLENVSVIKSEIAGIETIIRTIDDIPVEQFVDLASLVAYIDELFRERTKSAGFAEGVHALVKRKLHKVLRYVESAEE